MNILLTGANGFLGSHIAERLTQEHFQVRCWVRPTADIRFLKTLKSVEFVTGALDNPVLLKNAMRGTEVIIHNAGCTNALKPRDFYTINADSTYGLLCAARQYAPALKRFILVSSMAAIGPAKDHCPHIDDVTCPSPINHYGRSKLIAENYARGFSNQLPVTIIRPPLVYGPRDRKNLAFFKAMRWGIELLPLRGQTKVSIVYAADIAFAILKAISAPSPSGSTYFIDDGKIHQWSTLIAQLGKAVAKRKTIKINVPFPVIQTLAFLGQQYSRLTQRGVLLSQDKLLELKQLFWICDSGKARRELNWAHQVDWVEGARVTYDWYREAGWI